jgi:hypothetical protein
MKVTKKQERLDLIDRLGWANVRAGNAEKRLDDLLKIHNAVLRDYGHLMMDFSALAKRIGTPE